MAEQLLSGQATLTQLNLKQKQLEERSEQALRSKEKIINKQATELESLRMMLGEREGSLRGTRSDLTATEGALQGREVLLIRLEGELSTQGAAIEDKDFKIRSLKAELVATEAVLNGREQAIAKMQPKIAEMERSAIVAAEAFNMVRAKLSVCEVACESKTASLQEKRAEVMALEAALQGKEMALQGLDQATAALQAKFEAAKTTLAVKDAELRNKEEDMQVMQVSHDVVIHGKDEEIEVLKALLTDRDAETEQLEADLAACETSLQYESDFCTELQGQVSLPHSCQCMYNVC